MTEDQMEIASHAWIAAREGCAIAVDPESEEDAEALVERGWLRPAKGDQDEVGYAMTDQGKKAIALMSMPAGSGN